MDKEMPWAVCSPVDRYGTSRLPQFFPSKSMAEEYLAQKERIPISSLGELIERENDRLKRLRERGVCEDLESVPFPQNSGRELPQTIAAIPRSRSFVMVPVCCMAHHSGPACGLRAQDRLRLDKIGQPPGIDIDDFFDIYVENEMVRARRAEGNYDFVCCLGEDWQFDKIKREAKKGWGHHFAGNEYSHVAKILFGVIHDIDGAMRSIHKNSIPSAAALADFWRSYQVQNYLAQICGDPNLWRIQGRISGLPSSAICGDIPLLDTHAEREIDRACGWAYKSLWVLSHELLGSDGICCGTTLETDSTASACQQPQPATEPASLTQADTNTVPSESSDPELLTQQKRRQHGFKPDMVRHRKIVAIVEQHVSDWKTSQRYREDGMLKLICKDLDQQASDLMPESWKTEGKTPAALAGTCVNKWTEALEMAKTGKKLVVDQIEASLDAIRKAETS